MERVEKTHTTLTECMSSQLKSTEKNSEPRSAEGAPEGDIAGRSRLGLYQTTTRASAGELAGGVIHDINNPLQVMMLHLELLQSGKPMPNWIEMFGQQVQRITDLMNRLRGFAHGASQEAVFEPIDVNACVESALEMMGEEFHRGGITVRCALLPERVEILGNAYTLQQAFLELLINAREALSAGGIVAVEISRQGSRVVVRIADDGPGVAPKVQEELFKPFVTTKGEDRAGIGLALCLRTVLQHKGEVNLEEGGRGARFCIKLPVHATGNTP
jgi:signal transduction histidine kinase